MSLMLLVVVSDVASALCVNDDSIPSWNVFSSGCIGISSNVTPNGSFSLVVVEVGGAWLLGSFGSGVVARLALPF